MTMLKQKLTASTGLEHSNPKGDSLHWQQVVTYLFYFNILQAYPFFTERLFQIRQHNNIVRKTTTSTRLYRVTFNPERC